jgi:simple sugar transport system permease protein
MTSFLHVIWSTDFFYSILRVTTPILFASMGAVVANTAGIPNVALEGIMLLAAFFGMLGSAVTGSAGAGLLAAVVGGVFCAAVIAFFTLRYRTNVILAGIAVNSLASGGTVILLYLFFHDKGNSASVASKVLPRASLPLLQEIPVLGDILSGHHVLTYLSLISVLAVYLLIQKTPFGFHMRAVGRDPRAAESVGIHVDRVKLCAVLLSGFLSSFGGAFMSMGYVSWFARDMIAGRGWIAVAAEAMGRTTVLGTALAALLFGAADAFSNAVSALGLPSELVKTIPYVATLVGLIVFCIRSYRYAKGVRSKETLQEQRSKENHSGTVDKSG